MLFEYLLTDFFQFTSRVIVVTISLLVVIGFIMKQKNKIAAKAQPDSLKSRKPASTTTKALIEVRDSPKGIFGPWA